MVGLLTICTNTIFVLVALCCAALTPLLAPYSLHYSPIHIRSLTHSLTQSLTHSLTQH